VASFEGGGGIPSADGFAKRYELHYQPKKVTINGAEVHAQYGCINFHAKCYGGQGATLTVAVKNKWAIGWIRAWFYCKVPLLRSPRPVRDKGIYALHSNLCVLHFSMDPLFECVDNDAGDVAFVRATSSIGGWDIVDKYLACGLFPLSAGFGFGEITDSETTVSKVTLSLPEFPLAKLQGESNDHFLVRVELGIENVIGSYICTDHNACKLLSNGGLLNQVFEQADVAYGSRLEPGSEASKEATKKRKNDAGAGPAGKKAKLPAKRKMAALNAFAAPKSAGATSSKAAYAPMKIVPKASTP
jgi:hypothetical protein